MGRTKGAKNKVKPPTISMPVHIHIELEWDFERVLEAFLKIYLLKGGNYGTSDRCEK